MKVRDLIKELEKVNPDLDVVLSKDSEGNCYSPIAHADVGQYEPESTWSGEWNQECSASDINSVCLFPVN